MMAVLCYVAFNIVLTAKQCATKNIWINPWRHWRKKTHEPVYINLYIIYIIWISMYVVSLIAKSCWEACQHYGQQLNRVTGQLSFSENSNSEITVFHETVKLKGIWRMPRSSRKLTLTSGFYSTYQMMRSYSVWRCLIIFTGASLA